MEVQILTREFRYNGVALPDPGPQYSLEQVRDFYAAMYPEITSAAIEGPENIGAKTIYTFRRAVGTKGNDLAAEDAYMMDLPIELISCERRRQITEEGYTHAHDDEHEFGELAMVAALYACPNRIFVKGVTDNGAHVFYDPWPPSWDDKFDKRRYQGEIINPETYTKQEKFNLLIKAGALIIAEMERMQRLLRGDPDIGFLDDNIGLGQGLPEQITHGDR